MVLRLAEMHCPGTQAVIYTYMEDKRANIWWYIVTFGCGMDYSGLRSLPAVFQEIGKIFEFLGNLNGVELRRLLGQVEVNYGFLAGKSVTLVKSIRNFTDFSSM